MGNSERNSVIINETSKLVNDFASLYLSEKLSDIILIVDNKRIFAHKVILAARSFYFENLLYEDGQEIEQTELTISLNTSTDSFLDVLKFLYTGTITITPSNLDPTLDLIGLAHQCTLTDLEVAIGQKIKPLLSHNNICSVLNTANLYNLVELRNACHVFMDQQASEILNNDCFKHLSQNSLIKLLERDTFFAPEIEIFERVAQWCQVNVHAADLVVKCVRLSWLSVVEIVSKVWISKLVGCEDLLQAIAEIVDVKPKETTCRAKLLLEVNVATPEHKATVITGARTEHLLNGNRNVNNWTVTTNGDKTGLVIKFGFPFVINHIRMCLYDGDLRIFRYYVEVSLDQKKWKKVIDYSEIACRSYQHLYFGKEIVQYVKVVGTYSSLNEAFHLIFFEAYYKENIPRVVNGIVCPTSNVATAEKKAVVVEGTNGAALLDGVTTNYGSFTYHVIGAGSIVIQLAQPFIISSIKLKLWDQDGRFYKYYVETSVNKTEWTIAADHRNEENKSWQVLRFSERPISFIRITGTGASSEAGNGFHLLHLECPTSDEKTTYK
ncbi:hypothetical protein Zmor_026389 [Zophobas morio]|uniref:BTB domain-containing protein n=1 Tax=Zophobas morio TaxID=2755281 RepID=A0AA38HTR3_9CUCU|nr:hypothetical protein Zmor_026389 [Zophobas morio]